MKSALQEIIDTPKIEKGQTRFTAYVDVDDLAFIDALAAEFHTSRSKLVTNAIRNGARADYVFLESSEDPSMKESLDNIINKMEEDAVHENENPKYSGPYTSFGLHHYGQLSFLEQDGE